MNTTEREAYYLRDRTVLTAKQRRRIKHKENEAQRVMLDGTPVPRYARLRKRMERKDNRKLRAASAGIAQAIRHRLSNPTVTSGRSRRLGDGRAKSERNAS